MAPSPKFPPFCKASYPKTWRVFHRTKQYKKILTKEKNRSTEIPHYLTMQKNMSHQLHLLA